MPDEVIKDKFILEGMADFLRRQEKVKDMKRLDKEAQSKLPSLHRKALSP